MKSTRITESTCVYPAIFNLQFEKLPEEDRKMESWGWVSIFDLKTTLSEHFWKFEVPETPAFDEADIFKRYGLLCNKNLDRPLVTWASHREYVLDGAEFPTQLEAEDSFIPAGWAKRILAVVQYNIVRVTTSPWVRHELENTSRRGRGGSWSAYKQPRPFQGPYVIHQLIGHTHEGKKMVLCFDGYQEGGCTTVEAPSICTFS